LFFSPAQRTGRRASMVDPTRCPQPSRRRSPAAGSRPLSPRLLPRRDDRLRATVWSCGLVRSCWCGQLSHDRVSNLLTAAIPYNSVPSCRRVAVVIALGASGHDHLPDHAAHRSAPKRLAAEPCPTVRDGSPSAQPHSSCAWSPRGRLPLRTARGCILAAPLLSAAVPITVDLAPHARALPPPKPRRGEPPPLPNRIPVGGPSFLSHPPSSGCGLRDCPASKPIARPTSARRTTFAPTPGRQACSMHPTISSSVSPARRAAARVHSRGADLDRVSAPSRREHVLCVPVEAVSSRGG